MLNCNKISPAFSYLSSVQLGIIEGKVRVGVPISAGSLWILAIGVSRVPWCCLRTTHQGGIFHDLHAIFYDTLNNMTMHFIFFFQLDPSVMFNLDLQLYLKLWSISSDLSYILIITR
jgi:hypothetical protein